MAVHSFGRLWSCLCRVLLTEASAAEPVACVISFWETAGDVVTVSTGWIASPRPWSNCSVAIGRSWFEAGALEGQSRDPNIGFIAGHIKHKIRACLSIYVCIVCNAMDRCVCSPSLLRSGQGMLGLWNDVDLAGLVSCSAAVWSKLPASSCTNATIGAPWLLHAFVCASVLKKALCPQIVQCFVLSFAKSDARINEIIVMAMTSSTEHINLC